MNAPRTLSGILAIPAACALVMAAGSAGGARADATAGGDAPLQRLLASFDEVQRSISTLSADFTETTSSPLLQEPISARGRFYMTKPASVRWEYSEPEEMSFVIFEDQYTGYFPEQKKAETRDIHRWRERLFRLLGLGQVSSELQEAYDITLREDRSTGEAWLLELEPKKKRFRKRMESVLLWVDRDSYLPKRVEYSSKNGATRLIEFQDIRVNPDLSASLYRMVLPSDVEMTRGFSALSGLSATQD